MVKVLFVCLGNICRSPTAEGVFRHRLRSAGLEEQIATDSAGTAAYHVGKAPDSRSAAAARSRGIDIGDLRARAVSEEDFARYDLILAMDRSNYEHLRARCPREHAHKVRMFLEFAAGVDEEEVPDPYYGGERGFEHVLDLVEAAADGLLIHLTRRG